MNILDFFSDISPTVDQQNALSKIEQFLSNNTNIFILKGYAGSGKTTLIKGIVNYLKSRNTVPFLLAPTGRAAKVLKEKTKFDASTIHRAIYVLDSLYTKNDDNPDVAEREFKYIFPVRLLNERSFIIVDEASMISSKKSEQELFSFGSDILLNDLLTFGNPHKGGKIIFVGDPAQLLPVGDNQSCALTEDFFKSRGLSVDSYEMKQVVRQSIENLILKNATTVRAILELEHRNELIFETNEDDVCSINTTQITDMYCNKFPSPQINGGIIICYSNKQACNYNADIRERLYPKHNEITPGDIVMIVHNNYGNYGVDLYNGDMAKVIEASLQIEIKEAPIFCCENGEKVRKTIKLAFRDVKLQLQSGDIFNCKTIDSLLSNNSPDLNPSEMKSLYINFCMRHPHLKPGTDDFKRGLKSDPYYNAVRIKYGYAVTCHKAQGGEWESAFIDYTGRIGLSNECLRWIYTATTRCSKQLVGVNIPNISPLDKLKFSAIGKISQTSSDALSFGNVAETPYHSLNTPIFKRAKYWVVLDKLSETPYSISRVKSNPYMEEYYIRTESEELRADVTHNGAGVFNSFVTKGNTDDTIKMVKLLNDSVIIDYCVNYSPSNKALDKLYQNVSSASNELEITVTNIVEYPSNYFVTYYMKTSGLFSYIQFYFKNSGILTQAIAKSDMGADDKLLQLLIDKLANHVI